MNNKNRVIASYLAEEIVEDMRAYRDGITILYGFTNKL